MYEGGQALSHAGDGTAALAPTDRLSNAIMALPGGSCAEPTRDGRARDAEMS